MTKKKTTKVTYQQASLAMSIERERVVKDAQDTMSRTQCFTDAVFYGLPFEIGPDKPATRSLGWKMPSDDPPDGWVRITKIAAYAYSTLQVCRMLDNSMRHFPAFNADAIA